MKKAKKLNYKINLVFINTESPDIFKGRIRQRVIVIDGGHNVLPDDVIRRYYRSLNNLPRGLLIAERAFILDNSGARFRLLLSRENQTIKHLAQILPKWLKSIPLEFELTSNYP